MIPVRYPHPRHSWTTRRGSRLPGCTSAAIPRSSRSRPPARSSQLSREVAQYSVGSLIDDLKQRYGDLPDVVTYLGTVERNLVENIDDFRHGHEPQPNILGLPDGQTPTFRRYEVNLLLERREPNGAPVVFEDLPT